MMYLSEYYSTYDSKGKETLEDIALKHECTVREHKNSPNITASIAIYSIGRMSVLSEFPGNCSSLVLSSIQSYCKNLPVFTAILDTAIDICKTLNYGALFISGTHTDMRTYLIDKYGFDVILDGLVTPHSSYINYFLVKKIQEVTSG